MKPNVSKEMAEQLAKNVFGLSKIHEVKELISFCDRNFYIRGSGVSYTQTEFVLKILNSFDSQEVDQVEIKALQYLRENGFPCPQVYSVKGTVDKKALVRLPIGSESFVIENNQEICIVRMIEFLHGDVVVSVTRNPDLMYTVGKMVGSFSMVFKDFSHPGLKSKQNFQWDILEFLNFDKYIGCFQEASEMRLLIHEVHDAFVTKVKPYLADLRRGTVHNDLNGENILVTKPPYVICGLFDFGDMIESVLISELSNAMAFVMEGDGGVAYGGYLLAGYQATFTLPSQERDLLYYFVAARLAQLVMYSRIACTEKTSDKNLWACLDKYSGILSRFWRLSKGEVERIWRECQHEVNNNC